jgi:TonB family protein
MRLCYDERGKPIEVTLNESSGFVRLDEAAMRYARSVRMRPALIDGLPQSGCVVLPVRFSNKQPQETAYTGERMTANFQDIDVRTLLRLISATSGRTIVVDDAVTGTVTLRVENMPWDQVLDIVLSNKGLRKSVRGSEIVITTNAGVGQEADITDLDRVPNNLLERTDAIEYPPMARPTGR